MKSFIVGLGIYILWSFLTKNEETFKHGQKKKTEISGILKIESLENKDKDQLSLSGNGKPKKSTNGSAQSNTYGSTNNDEENK